MKNRFFVSLLVLILCLNSISAKNKDKDESNNEEVVAAAQQSENTKAEDDRVKKKEVPEKKMADYVELSGEILSTITLGLVDTNDDSDEINVGIAKNRPVFTTEADVSAKLLTFKHENIIFGPVAYTMIEGKMDHKDVVTKLKLKEETNSEWSTVKWYNTKNIWFFEKGEFFNYAGIRIGTTFGNAAFAGSKFTATIPFMVNFLINHSNDAVTVPSMYANPDHHYVNTDETDDNCGTEEDYFSHLILGTNLVLQLKVKSKPYHFEFDYKNSIMLGGDVFATNSFSLYSYELFYLRMKNSLSFSIKPFNFISNKVDVAINLGFRSTFDFAGQNIEMKKRAYIGFKWDGLKYFAIGYKPFIYSDEHNYLTANVINGDFSSYENVYNFSTEISFSFGNKYFNVEVAYEPSYYTYDDSDEDHAADNSDAIREHKITTAIEIKF